MKKIIFYICIIFVAYTLIKSGYYAYQYNNIYKEFKKTEIINTNIDIMPLMILIFF